MDIDIKELNSFLPYINTYFGACESAMRHFLHCVRNNLILNWRLIPNKVFLKTIQYNDWEKSLITIKEYNENDISNDVNEIIENIKKILNIKHYVGIDLKLEEDGHCITLINLQNEIYMVHAYAGKFETKSEKINDISEWLIKFTHLIIDYKRNKWAELFKVDADFLDNKKIISVGIHI